MAREKDAVTLEVFGDAIATQSRDSVSEWQPGLIMGYFERLWNVESGEGLLLYVRLKLS